MRHNLQQAKDEDMGEYELQSCQNADTSPLDEHKKNTEFRGRYKVTRSNGRIIVTPYYGGGSKFNHPQRR
jgi:hypothetical protein